MLCGFPYKWSFLAIAQIKLMLINVKMFLNWAVWCRIMIKVYHYEKMSGAPVATMTLAGKIYENIIELECYKYFI